LSLLPDEALVKFMSLNPIRTSTMPSAGARQAVSNENKGDQIVSMILNIVTSKLIVGRFNHESR